MVRFEAHGFPVAPVVLGLVLGPIVEKNFMMSMIKTEWDITLFFTRPVSAILCIITIFIWFPPIFAALLGRTKKKD
jgi:TctA family transporter